MKRANATITENGEIEFEISKSDNSYCAGIVEITCDPSNILDIVKEEIEENYPSLILQCTSNNSMHANRLQYKESSCIDRHLGIDSSLCTSRLSIHNRSSDNSESSLKILQIVEQFLED